MPVYEYVGMTSAGKKTRGVFDADNPRALRDQLKSQGVFITEYFEGKAAAKRRGGDVQIKLPGTDRISLMDIVILTRQLATLQKAGIPLVESLSALIEQCEKEKLKGVVSQVRQKVNEGSSLAGAMAEHPEAFSDLYINMIKAGESSGNLDIVLLRLTEFLDGQLGLQQKLVAAAVYPLLMVVLGTFIVAYLMASVVPKVTQIFDDQEAALPFITQVLIFASDVIAGYWWLILLVIGASIYGFRRWKSTPAGHYKWDKFVLRMPVFGDLVRMIAVSRFAKTMSTLLASGVPLLGALDIVKNILGNVILIDVIEKARLNIREGESVAGPLKRSGEFPPMVTHMIAVGERTGELESMLESVADAYDQQVSSRVAALTSLLEPLMIVVMGGAVGFIVFAILLPILKMNEAFSQ